MIGVIHLGLRSEITVKVRLNDDPHYLMELTVDENDTFEAVAIRIQENVLTGKSKFGLFYRNKTLDLQRTLKQEKFESGETLDVKTFSNRLIPSEWATESDELY